jgi:hypothetical protein
MDENMESTRALWTAYLQDKHGLAIPLKIEDVPIMMALLKISRTMHGDASFVDHYIDMIGYSGIAGAVAQPKEDEPNV